MYWVSEHIVDDAQRTRNKYKKKEKGKKKKLNYIWVWRWNGGLKVRRIVDLVESDMVARAWWLEKQNVFGDYNAGVEVKKSCESPKN